MYRKLRRAMRGRGPTDGPPAQSSGGGESLLTRDLSENMQTLLNLLGKGTDLIVRRLITGGRLQAVVIYLRGMVDQKLLHEAVIRPLMSADLASGATPLQTVESEVISAGNVERVNTISLVSDGIIAGKAAVLLTGSDGALIVSVEGWERRSVEEPRSEVVVRGPRESFTESLQSNVALVRRRVRDVQLTIEYLKIGRRTKTDVVLAYINGLADDDLVAEARSRLERIKTDSILDSGYIEQFVEDQTYSPFPTVGFSERPDVIAARLLEGRVAIMADGSPEALTMPYLFLENFQSPEDYYTRVFLSTLFRWFRFLAFTISVMAPSVFVALTTYHQELVPTQLLLTLAASREGTPFPTVLETIGLGLVFEILREAGVRLPRPVGQAVSIVGVLVVGQAAVAAGFVDAVVVIVSSMTAIASFLNPHLTEAGIIVRLTLTIAAGVLGGYGVVIGMLVLLIHLVGLRSFGTAYLAPAMPLDLAGLLQDTVVRSPVWAMKTRPEAVSGGRSSRQGTGQSPGAPQAPRPGGKR